MTVQNSEALTLKERRQVRSITADIDLISTFEVCLLNLKKIFVLLKQCIIITK